MVCVGHAQSEVAAVNGYIVVPAAEHLEHDAWVDGSAGEAAAPLSMPVPPYAGLWLTRDNALVHLFTGPAELGQMAYAGLRPVLS